MSFKNIRQNRWYKFFSNIYVLVLTVFAIWMLFFDTNSFFTHQELNKEIKKLKKQKEHLETEIARDKEVIKKLKSEEGLEKFGREEYYLKKDKEEIYIIEDEDSLKKKKNE
ncbi:septum formation initiator family protein [Leptobacterium flavescens]|uniref:Septum formation initiator family protein n=1 Tax=Leptobacterium flavescens TaxID=472055 RepID=A0A6P0UFW4_9FLAO|nr:septum formation initiator family protein [Leptobacterium flavescens]NER12125.1 septum formation initiator family protein [Leptobacterium flavescens]